MPKHTGKRKSPLERKATQHQEFVGCPGTDDDDLTLAPDDLATKLGIDVIEDTGIVALINSLPRW